MLVLPCELVELTESRPAIVANCFSSGSATAEAIVSGLAPGRLALHLNGGEVDRRQIADRQQLIRHHAEDADAQHDERRRNRPLDEELGEIHDPAFAPLASRMLTRLPGTSRRWPSVTTVSPAVESLLDHRLGAGEPRDGDRPQLHGLVRLDDVDVVAVRTRLDGNRRHDDGGRIRSSAGRRR